MKKDTAKRAEKSLTLKQRQLYEFIVNRENWRPPSYVMMMRAMGYRSKNAIAAMLKLIANKGFEIPKINE